MTLNLVDRDKIESLVEAQRDDTKHFGRARHLDQTFYILHSRECLDSGIDLRECEYSVALTNTDVSEWQDRPYWLKVFEGRLYARIECRWPVCGWPGDQCCSEKDWKERMDSLPDEVIATYFRSRYEKIS